MLVMEAQTRLLLVSLLPLVAVVPRMLGFVIAMQLLPETIFPAAVRNALALALSLMAYPVAAVDPALRGDDYLWWTGMLVKEALVGLVLGYLLGLPLALFESFGTLIDTQSGSNSAATYDPLAGHELGVTGALLRNLGVTLIAASGALLGAVQIVLWSYRVWPVSRLVPPALEDGAAPHVLPLFDALMGKLILLAFPVVFTMLALELAIGRINRSVPQLNVFTVAMPAKAAVGALVLAIELLLLAGSGIDLLQFPQAALRRWLGL